MMTNDAKSQLGVGRLRPEVEIVEGKDDSIDGISVDKRKELAERTQTERKSYNIFPSKEHCDFCTVVKPTKAYRAKNFTMPTPANMPQLVESKGDWAACDRCADLVDNEKWQALTDRAIWGFQQTKGPMDKQERALLREQLRATYLMFDKARKGYEIEQKHRNWFRMNKPVDVVDSLFKKVMAKKDHSLPEGTTYGRFTSNTLTKPTVDDGVLVKIQNVCDYYLAHSVEHRWNEIKSFTCVKPPFPLTVFSYDFDFLNPSNNVITRRHVNTRVRDLTPQQFREYVYGDGGPNLPQKDLKELEQMMTEAKAETHSVMHVVIAVDAGIVPGRWHIFLDKTGCPIVNDNLNLGWLWLRDAAETKRIHEIDVTSPGATEFAINRHGMIALAALQFMNCRNVEVLDNPPSRQQRRQCEREGKKPPVTYKTLMIHPFGQKRVARQSDGSAMQGVSLHIVRGHFKDYRLGDGLGRYHVKGMWWWSPNIRGSAEAGRVEKDYEVEPLERLA